MRPQPVPRRLAPRTFLRSPTLSFGAGRTGNALILGENLEVLQALRTQFTNRIQCVYLDPPYNNQDRYHHYLDTRSHADWLDMLVERLAAILPLLTASGSVWLSIDDREAHYLKVAADRVFGRANFISTIVWQQRTTRENRKVFSNNHEYLLVYARDARRFGEARNSLPTGATHLARYKNPDDDPRGPWQSVSANVQDGHATRAQYYEVVAPNGTRHRPPKGRCWVYSRARMEAEIAAGNIWFGRDGNGVPRIKRFLETRTLGLTPDTLWLADAVGTTDEAKKHLKRILPDVALFETPKPERLLSRILHIATREGDLVLDAFLGSGTTAAVAHKMRRRYIGVEEGPQAITHCAARLKMVVSGEQAGLAGELPWPGGGGFDFYRLKQKQRVRRAGGSRERVACG